MSKVNSYFFGRSVSKEGLKGLDAEEKTAVMRNWFLEKYEDPAQHTPYNSREGGYQYIYGGPYEAAEELEGEFGDAVEEEIIANLAEELAEITDTWTKRPTAEDFDDYLSEAFSSSDKQLGAFQDATIDINKLLETNYPAGYEYTAYKLLYANVITALEAYLSDTFYSLVRSNEKYKRNFVENVDIQDKKFKLSEIYTTFEAINTQIEKFVLDMSWHNLGKAKTIYTATFKIEFPSINELSRLILTRHDIIHRNGKNKDGKNIYITKTDVINLILESEKLVKELDEKLISCRSDF